MGDPQWPCVMSPLARALEETQQAIDLAEADKTKLGDCVECGYPIDDLGFDMLCPICWSTRNYLAAQRAKKEQ